MMHVCAYRNANNPELFETINGSIYILNCKYIFENVILRSDMKPEYTGIVVDKTDDVKNKYFALERRDLKWKRRRQ